ncbi:hypothetical protein TrST_g5773 [Triparma strigata]|uniref:Uncharacterized protein n=1 Tax=Triparma strigata TaxID=1606541 RepID=A0A9W7BQH0_9STRA|nr:hypothetical protein TrST_g5773 [Triparma strigata]
MATHRGHAVIMSCWRSQVGHGIGMLPEVLLHRILEYAESPPTQRRATSWAHMMVEVEDVKEEVEGVKEEEAESSNNIQPKSQSQLQPQSQKSNAFVSGHGQFLEKNVFSSPSPSSPSSTRISIESFVCGALLATSSCIEMGSSPNLRQSKDEVQVVQLGTSPTSVCDILGLWGVSSPRGLSTHHTQHYLGDLSALNPH